MSLINYKNINLKGTNRLIGAGLCSSVLALAACQPATDDITNDAETASVTTEDTAADTTVIDTEDDTATIDNASTTDTNTQVTQVATPDFGKEYVDSMDDMHEDMMQGILDKDADMAFAKGMLPHHEGAIVMAEVQFKYGKDEEMRQLAQDIIDAQNTEIKLVQDWINEHS